MHGCTQWEPSVVSLDLALTTSEAAPPDGVSGFSGWEPVGHITAKGGNFSMYWEQIYFEEKKRGKDRFSETYVSYMLIVEGIRLAIVFQDGSAGSPIVGLSPVLVGRCQHPGASRLLGIHCRESPATSSPIARTHRWGSWNDPVKNFTTGVGKSTLGNFLLGNDPRGENTVFRWSRHPVTNVSWISFFCSVGDDKESHTLEISWKVGNWLGSGDCFTVIDTPGYC